MFIAICLVTIFVLMLIRYKYYEIKPILLVPLAVSVAAMGLAGTYIMFFIENGGWYGKSFFGAVLFFPILLFPVAVIFRIKLVYLLSFSTIPGLALLAIYKWNCYKLGCCGGRVLWFSDKGIPTHFPSQLAEMGAAIILVVVLLILERNPKFKNEIYPLCLIFYGTTRFVLNYFRWEQNDFILGMPAGNLWSLVSIGIGAVWLLVKRRNKRRK